MTSESTNTLRGVRQRLTTTHWTAISVFAAITAFTVVAASQAWWTTVVIGLGCLLFLILSVTIYGFNTLSRRVLRQARKLLQQVKTIQRDSRRPTAGSRLAPEHGAVWYWVDQVRRKKGHLTWFTNLAIRTRLIGARDVLAYAATSGQYGYEGLALQLESSRIDMYQEAVDDKLRDAGWKPGLLALAQVLYSQRTSEIDLLDALTLYDIVSRISGPQAIKNRDQTYYADLLTWRGRYEEATLTLTQSRDKDADRTYSQQFLKLNAINPNVTGDGKKRWEWLETLNEIWAQEGFAPVTLEEGEGPWFYRLTADDVPRVEDGPLVSIIMPIYEPSEATDVAISSLLNQSWSNFELLIMDDASPQHHTDGEPTGYREQLERWAVRDSRIKLVFAEENRGAYAVRNDGFDLAQGEFVTVADKDDWHHPQKIERLVQELSRDQEKPAVVGNWVRVDEGLQFLIRSSTGRVVYMSMASLMIRREEVKETIGYWDSVRKSGDSEFRRRLEVAFETKIQPAIQAPLAFALLGEGNLTSADMGAGYMQPDRRAYLRSYRAFHRQIRQGEVSPYMPKHPEQRLFTAPRNFLPQRETLPKAKYDVVFMSEFGFVAGNSTSLFNEMTVALNNGLRVGLIPVNNGLISSAEKRQFNERIDHLVLSGTVDRLSLETEAETDLLVVRWPASLQMNPGIRSRVEAKHAVVVANHPPYELSGERRSYDLRQVTRNIEETFGLRPVWAPQSEQVAAMLAPMMPASDMTPFAWKGIIRPRDPGANAANHDQHRQPVIGRHARDDQGKWPSSEQVFRQVYPVDGSVQVTILGGAEYPKSHGFLPEDAEGWKVYGFNEVTVEEYLSELDFFVYYHSDGWLEAFGMAILEAMNHGVVCVLPKHFEPVFKEAAVYAAPSNAMATVRELWDSERYAAQQQRAYEFIQRECTPEAYIRRLQRLGVARLETQ